jgi:Tol biopolymer transport system component
MTGRYYLMALVLVAGCGYSTSGPGPDPVPQLPYACGQEFASTFQEPWMIMDRPAQMISFSPDCVRCITIEADSGILRLSDLEKRTTTEVDSQVYLARFSGDSERVLYLKQTDQTFELFVAGRQGVFKIDSNLNSVLIQAPGGKSVAYLKDYDDQTYLADLYLARLDVSPPAAEKVAGLVMGSPSFASDGKHLVFLSDPLSHTQEAPDYPCTWNTAGLRSYSVDDRSLVTVARDIMAYSFQVSSDGQRVYAVTDYDCLKQTRALRSFSLSGQSDHTLLPETTSAFAPSDMLEIPELGFLVSAIVSYGDDPADYRSELWSTRTDGSGTRMLAENVMSNAQTCMYFIPYQLAADNILLYLQRESYDIMALDLDDRDGWKVSGGNYGLYVDLSPDGRNILHLSSAERDGPADLVLTGIASAKQRVLAHNVMSGARFDWTPSGERVIFFTDNSATGQPRTLRATGVDSLEEYIVADDVLPGWLWSYDYALHPGGHLIAVQRIGGLFLQLIP